MSPPKGMNDASGYFLPFSGLVHVVLQVRSLTDSAFALCLFRPEGPMDVSVDPAGEAHLSTPKEAHPTDKTERAQTKKGSLSLSLSSFFPLHIAP